MIAPTFVNAAVPEIAVPYASQYLSSYNSRIYPAEDGTLQIWFWVTGTQTWTYLGVLTIQLYESTDNENWYWVKTFSNTEYDNMMSENDNYHMSYVEYDGVSGRYYKAYVTVWGGYRSIGDSFSFWTPVVQAT